MLATLTRRAPPPPRDPLLRVETACDPAAVDRLEQPWRDLAAEAKGATFFQSFEWCRTVWHRLAASATGQGDQARIVVVSKAGRPVLIWPLALRRALGQTIAQDLTEPFGQYSDALIAPDMNADEALDAAWAEIRTWGLDALILRKVRRDAALRPWLEARSRPLGEPMHAPFVDFRDFADFAAYHASITPKTRKNLRNYRNRLARHGALVHHVVDDTAQRLALTEHCFALRSDWLSANGLSSTAFLHPQFSHLVRDLAEGGPGRPRLLMMHLELQQGTSPPADIAIQWGFEHNGRYYAFMSAKTAAFDAFSPGRLHLEDVLGACARRNIAVADFLVPDMPYKATWATGRVRVDSFGLPLTLRGRLLVDGWHGLTRPGLKSLALMMPRSLRAGALDGLAALRGKRPRSPRAVGALPGE